MAIKGAFNVPFTQMREYINAKKAVLPSETWQGIDFAAHSHAFAITGAVKLEFLHDVKKSIEDAANNGTGFAKWKKQFRAAVKGHGGDNEINTKPSGEVTATEAGNLHIPLLSKWRQRVIYETNMKSAYAAGKYARLTDEDGLTNFPYWQYVHGYYGKPNEPRDEHVKWDGMILPANHPWFDTHFPPNGWNCNCGVEQISAKEAKVTERPSGKNDVPPEWATNVGINDAAGAQSLMRHIERISSKGGEYKIIAQKAFEHLKENSAKIYGKTLDVWVDEVFDGNYTKQKKERTVAITDEGIITADKESVNHAIRTKKPTQQRLSREQAKELPAFIADAESVYEDKKNGGLLYFKKLNDEKEVKISVKNNKFITAVKQNNKESQGNIEYKRGLKR